MSEQIIDPLKFKELCWPQLKFSREQIQIIYSVRDNPETVVPAGNGLGKDFISGFIALWFFASRRPGRVVTTSVKYDQLNDVLWGEIRRFLETARVNLPFEMTHMHIYQKRKDGTRVPLSELVGQCVSKGEALLGRHLPRDIPRTLVIFDEASGIDTSVYESADTWAHRRLIIGNPFPCNNFFFKAVKEGNVRRANGELYRQVIRIKAEDSPNIRLAMAEVKAGKKPSGKVLIPGMIDYDTYLDRRKLWDRVRQCISLDAEFYEGAEVLMFPPEWLNRAETIAASLSGRNRSGVKTLGIDSAQGGDNTAWAICDELGLIHLRSRKTPDTSVIVNETLALMREHNIQATNVLFDTGGGGKQHADQLRQNGYNVRTVAFGESATPPKRRGLATIEQRTKQDEIRYAYFNRRAELYGSIRLQLDATNNPRGFGLPAEYHELRRQLSQIPLHYDGEGRIKLPPKNRHNPNSTNPSAVSLMEILGCSPDEADALALATWGLTHRGVSTTAGAIRFSH